MRRLLVVETWRMSLGDLTRQSLSVETLALAHGRPRRVDALSLGRRVSLRDEPAGRRVGRVRVRQAVGGRQLDGLDQVVQVVDRVVPPASDVPTLEPIERL